jgi:predicted dehydrogenase
MRFGIIGTGRISEWVLKGAFYDPRFTAVAICSRTEEKAHLFASQYGIPFTFTSVEELASCPSVDAVYIGTPNSTHALMAILEGGMDTRKAMETAISALVAEAMKMQGGRDEMPR